MLKSVVRLASLLVALAGAMTAAHAQSGQAQAVDPGAEARGKQTRQVVVGLDVFIGDRIVTDGSGEVQILFADNTRLVVGPRSALLIDDYLLREDGSAGKMVLDVLGGTFRFITGGAAKDKYVINTPSGTIGVRGTAFQLVSTDIEDWVMVESGIVIGCGEGGGECATSAGICEIMVIRPGSAEIAGHGDDFSGEERDALKEKFKYTMSQLGLLNKYRVRGAERCLRKPPVEGPGNSLVDSPAGDIDPCLEGCSSRCSSNC
jgi:hypothetical protein